MKTFKEFIQEEFLLEILDSKFTVNHDENLKSLVNRKLKDKIHGSHTAIMSSDHMDKFGIKVMRLKNHKNEIEYHILNTKHDLGKLDKEHQDTKSMIHALKIIHDDAKFYIDNSNKIKLQSSTPEQHKAYQKIAKHMIKGYGNKNISDVGLTKRLDGEGESPTLMIETSGFNAMDWNKYLDIKQQESNENI